MTDREILELAAKAAGIDCDAQLDDGTVVTAAEAPSFWNPLTDDGDALRLAVKLSMDIASDQFNGDTLVMCNSRPCETFKPINEPHGTDPYAATRRAIVRAAAEIGRSMG